MEVDKAVPGKIEKELPRVPIKTYQWEDVRRARKKGGYPWTHLLKPPYDGEEHPEEYTLEAYRRSRSRSTVRSGSVSTFGDWSPSPIGRHDDESRDHSRTPSTVKVERNPSIKRDKALSASQRFSINENSSAFANRYERSLSPPAFKLERSRSLNREFGREFERSKSPSRSFSEKKSQSPSEKRRSRSPTKRENTNSAMEQMKTETIETMENGTKDENDRESIHKSEDETPDVRLEQIDEGQDITDNKDEAATDKPSEELLDSSKPGSSTSKESKYKSTESKRKLKRRLSVQSSYSRISLTKQGILDRIKSTKRSLRMPRMVKRSKSDVTHEKKPINTKGRKSSDAAKNPEKPVYIHIPLKPPPGQSDEFSYLEFEENPPPLGQKVEQKSSKKELFGDDRDGSPIVGVILEFDDPDKEGGMTPQDMDHIISKIGNGANVQQIDAKDLFPEISEQSEKIKEIVDSLNDNGKIFATNGAEVLEEVEVQNKKEALEKIKLLENGSIKRERSETPSSDARITLELQRNTSDTTKLSPEPPSLKRLDSDRLVIQELSSREGSTTPDPSRSIPLVTEPDEDNISQYLDKDEPMEINTQERENSKTESAESDSPFKSNSQNEFVERTLPLKGSDLDIPSQRKGRAKSEEPASRKRKLSIDSSYSRKSLSKLAFLKKFKDFTDKIKLPSFGKSENKPDKAPKDNEVNTPKKSEKTNLVTPKVEEPKYIYIPLKPPEGETDEFSKCIEGTPSDINDTNKELKRRDTETSEETTSNNVQLIILTPPSDDEILDAPNQPDTPSESDQKFFDNIQIDNLKCLAKKIVDDVYPDSKPLQTVQEEKYGSEDNISKLQSTSETSREQVLYEITENNEKGNKLEGKDLEVKQIEGNKTEDKETEAWKEKEAQEKKSEKKEAEDEERKTDTKLVLQEKIFVDEEDGLKLNEVAVAMIKEELAKESLTEVPENKENSKPEESTKVKKRVLFKKKNKTDDGEYEDINIPDSQRSSVEIRKQEDDKIKEDVEIVTKLDEGSSNVKDKKWSTIE